jgi:hypothetical protein
MEVRQGQLCHAQPCRSGQPELEEENFAFSGKASIYNNNKDYSRIMIL